MKKHLGKAALVLALVVVAAIGLYVSGVGSAGAALATSTSGTAQRDPLVTAWYGISVPGLTPPISCAVAEVTGLGSENDIVEYKAAAPSGKFILKYNPGKMKWNTAELRRGITDDTSFWRWRQLVVDGQVDQARKNATITMFNQQGTEIAKWELTNAWPCKISGPAMSSPSGNQAGFESITLAYEGVRRVK